MSASGSDPKPKDGAVLDRKEGEGLDSDASKGGKEKTPETGETGAAPSPAKADAKKDAKFDVAKESKAIADLVYQMNVNVERFALPQFKEKITEKIKRNGKEEEIEKEVVKENYYLRPANIEIFNYENSKFGQEAKKFKEEIEKVTASSSADSPLRLVEKIVANTLRRSYESMINGVEFDSSKFNASIKKARDLIGSSKEGLTEKDTLKKLETQLDEIEKKVVTEQIKSLKDQLTKQKQYALATLLWPMGQEADRINFRDWKRVDGNEEGPDLESGATLLDRETKVEHKQGHYSRPPQNMHGVMVEERFTIFWGEKGIVQPIGKEMPLTGENFRQGYEQAFDFIKHKMRSTNVQIEFPGLAKGYTEGAMKYALENLDTLFKIAEAKGIEVELGSVFLGALNRQGKEVVDKYIRKYAEHRGTMQQKVRDAQARTKQLAEGSEKRVEENTIKGIEEKTADIKNDNRLPADDKEAVKKLTDTMYGNPPLHTTNEAKVEAVEKEVRSYSQRGEALSKAYKMFQDQLTLLKADIMVNPDKKFDSRQEKLDSLAKEIVRERDDVKKRSDICLMEVKELESKGLDAKGGAAPDLNKKLASLGELDKNNASKLSEIKSDLSKDLKDEIDRAYEEAKRVGPAPSAPPAPGAGH